MAEFPFPIPFTILIWTQSHPAGLSEPTADGWRIGLHPLEGLPGALVPLLELVPDRARLLAVRCGGRRVILADRRRPATSMQRPVGRRGAPSADNARPIAERRGSGSVQSHFSVTGAVTRLATAGRRRAVNRKMLCIIRRVVRRDRPDDRPAEHLTAAALSPPPRSAPTYASVALPPRRVARRPRVRRCGDGRLPGRAARRGPRLVKGLDGGRRGVRPCEAGRAAHSRRANGTAPAGRGTIADLRLRR